MTFLPVALYKDKKIIATGDGSLTFYSCGYGEAYKTKSLGAYTESLHKFVLAGGITDILKERDARLLDICFGAGMNLAATIERMELINPKGRLHTVSVEKDPGLINLVENTEILFPLRGYDRLREAIKKGCSGNFSLELYILDARKVIKKLSGKFDVVYFDPFSKRHNPEMWDEDIFTEMRKLLTPEGRLVTYASGKEIRRVMEKAGFILEDIPSLGSRRHPGSSARIAFP